MKLYRVAIRMNVKINVDISSNADLVENQELNVCNQLLSECKGR